MVTGSYSRLAALALALLTVAAVVPLWVADPLPLQDVPNHLVKVEALRAYLAGDARARDLWALNPNPVPNSFCYVVLLVLSGMVPLETTVRVYLTGCLPALALTGWRFVRANGRDPALVLVLPGLMYTAFLAKGFLNFLAGLPMYLGALMLAMREPFRRGDALALTGLGLVLYFTHGFVFIALVVAVAGWIVLRRPPLREVARRAGALAPGGLLLLVWMRGGVRGADGESTLVFGSLTAKVWDALAWLLGFAYGSAAGLAWLAAVTVVVGGALGTTLAAIYQDRHDQPVLRALRGNPLLLLSVMMAGCYFFGFDVAESNARARWLPLGSLTMLGGLVLPRPASLRYGAAAVLVLATIGLNLANFRVLQRESERVREYTSGMASIEDGAAVLPVNREDHGSSRNATLHAWGWYLLAHGGWAPYVHAWRTGHPIMYRALPWGPGEDVVTALDDATVERVAACYDYVLLWDPRSSGEDELSARFVPVFERGRLHIWRNRAGVRRRTPATAAPCRLETAHAAIGHAA